MVIDCPHRCWLIVFLRLAWLHHPCTQRESALDAATVHVSIAARETGTMIPRMLIKNLRSSRLHIRIPQILRELSPHLACQILAGKFACRVISFWSYFPNCQSEFRCIRAAHCGAPRGGREQIKSQPLQTERLESDIYQYPTFIYI